MVILILDFVSIYLFTGKIKVAFGFMIVSNIYTTLAYFFHERIYCASIPYLLEQSLNFMSWRILL